MFRVNLVISRDGTTLVEIQDLWKAFERKAPLPVAIITDQRPWDRLLRCGGMPPRPSLHPHSGSNLRRPNFLKTVGPRLKFLRKFLSENLRLTKDAPLRMLAPSFYRTDFVGSCSHDDPALIISEVAKNTPRQASLLSGGTWQRVPHKKEPSSLAMFRLLVSLATKVVAQSGHPRYLYCPTWPPKPNKAPSCVDTSN